MKLVSFLYLFSINGLLYVAGKTLLLLVQNEHNGQMVRLAGENGTSGDPAGLLAATTFLCGRRTSTTEQTAVLGTSSYSCSHLCHVSRLYSSANGEQAQRCLRQRQ